jgi:hypothetical protein
MSLRFSIGFVAALAVLVSAGPALGASSGSPGRNLSASVREGTIRAMVIMPDPGVRHVLGMFHGTSGDGEKFRSARVISNGGLHRGLLAPSRASWATFPSSFESQTKPHADGLLLD